MANFGFNVADTEYEERNFDPLPKGEYTLRALEADLKDTSSGEGKYIAAVFEVVKPSEYQGRKVFNNFNIFNPSEKAERIGREQVAGWARACGRPNAKDSDELLERPFSCRLDIEKGTGGYSDKNRIAAFLMPGAEKASSAKSSSKFEEVAKEEPKEEKKEDKSRLAKATGGKRQPWDD